MDGFDNTSSSSINSNFYNEHFQSINNIYELQSVIHKLTIEKQKQAILYKNSISNHSQEVSDYTQQISTLSSENERVSFENKELASCCKILRKENSDIKKAYDCLQSIFDNFSKEDKRKYLIESSVMRKNRRDAEKMRSQFEDLEKTVEEGAEKIRQLKNYNSVMRTQYEKKISDLQNHFSNQKLSLSNMIELKEDEIKIKTSNYEKQLQLYRSSNLKLEEQNIRIMKELNEVKNKLSREVVKKYPIRSEEREQRGESDKKKHKQLLERFENLMEEHSMTVKNEMKLRKQLQQSRNLNESLQNQLQMLEKRASVSQKQFKIVNYSEIKTQLPASMIHEVTNLKKIITNYEDSSSQNKRKIQSLESRLEIFEKRNSENEKENAFLKKKLKQSKNQSEKLCEQVHHLTEEANQNNSNLAQAKRQKQILEQRIRDFEIELQREKQIKIKCEKCKTIDIYSIHKIKQLQISNKQLKKDRQSQLLEISALDKKIMELLAKIADVQMQKNSVCSLESERLKRIVEGERKLKQKDLQIIEKEHDNESLKKSIDNLKKQNNRFKQEIENIKEKEKQKKNKKMSYQKFQLFIQSSQFLPKKDDEPIVKKGEDFLIHLGDLKQIAPKNRSKTDRQSSSNPNHNRAEWRQDWKLIDKKLELLKGQNLKLKASLINEK